MVGQCSAPYKNDYRIVANCYISFGALHSLHLFFLPLTVRPLQFCVHFVGLVLKPLGKCANLHPNLFTFPFSTVGEIEVGGDENALAVGDVVRIVKQSSQTGNEGVVSAVGEPQSPKSVPLGGKNVTLARIEKVLESNLCVI